MSRNVKESESYNVMDGCMFLSKYPTKMTVFGKKMKEKEEEEEEINSQCS